MKVVFSGAIAPRSRQPDELGDDLSTETSWICRVCTKKNNLRTDDDSSEQEQQERCTCCGRERDPSWLWLDKFELQLHVGMHVQVPDDETFGIRVGVVSEVDFVKQRVQVLAISSRSVSNQVVPGHPMSVSGRHSKYRFETLEYNSGHVHQLIPVSRESNDQVQQLVAALESHGLCGACHRVFRIAQGEVGHETMNREAIRALQEDIKRLSDTKIQNIKLRDYDRVLENTSSLQNLKLRLSQQKRSVEFLTTISCPHCGWIAAHDK